ncbi:GNAT family N-acetyltransferase [Bacillus changyiensis]|uniref:GNAT family N-acetyltransferase n=1 Tax=Bacillus changyiensis TaxID=3004103 RepID=UPI0022E444F8|nr:GNAT family N-acetyltransferase [Bacillus changyiensis]MDA1477311.1 GNAT family N-acetyltransferase [Bacillus changyiensis]
MILIRKAKASDADSIANVHVESWKTTYQGVLPDDTLSRLSVKNQAELWRTSLSDSQHEDIVYVAEETDGKMIGFASGGPNRDPLSKYKGEVSALYLLLQYQRKGIGSQLMKAIVEELVKKNIKSLMVWVLAGNPSINFYKKLGGRQSTTKQIQIGEDDFKAIAIGWTDINSFLL